LRWRSAAAHSSGTSEADEAHLFYVAATRATQTLYITLGGTGAYMDRFPA
jgi:superfamily I DNA/RNA helicase